MSEETLSLIWSRRTIRDFERREVEKETVDKLKAMTLRAPSAGNMEMYSILEVEDKEKKKQLAAICDNFFVSCCEFCRVILMEFRRKLRDSNG